MAGLGADGLAEPGLPPQPLADSSTKPPSPLPTSPASNPAIIPASTAVLLSLDDLPHRTDAEQLQDILWRYFSPIVPGIGTVTFPCALLPPTSTTSSLNQWARSYGSSFAAQLSPTSPSSRYDIPPTDPWRSQLSTTRSSTATSSSSSTTATHAIPLSSIPPNPKSTPFQDFRSSLAHARRPGPADDGRDDSIGQTSDGDDALGVRVAREGGAGPSCGQAAASDGVRRPDHLC